MAVERYIDREPCGFRVPDDAWAKVKAILDRYDPPKRVGRRRTDPRLMLEAILYHLRTGCPWARLPEGYPDDSTLHRTYQRWQRLGVLRRVLAALATEDAARADKTAG